MPAAMNRNLTIERGGCFTINCRTVSLKGDNTHISHKMQVNFTKSTFFIQNRRVITSKNHDCYCISTKFILYLSEIKIQFILKKGKLYLII